MEVRLLMPKILAVVHQQMAKKAENGGHLAFFAVAFPAAKWISSD
ncbi:MAG TPA: hypothetical protein V6D18_00430 [Thermosynechococcaceae cyanobacterium]|jgi:hypothetical protein